jgi:RNA polymerase sigma factor (sigma-70 family)
MPTSPMTRVVKHLRRAALLQDGAGQTDGQLLAWFIRDRDEAAFETLVRRHGPMVMSVCRRLLRNHHDAEDAFQATFLVLVRKAASIAPPDMLPNWLHGVAYHTALKAKAISAKRSLRERHVPALPEPEEVQRGDFWQQLLPLLDRELSCLPDKYRMPIILCDLEGRPIKEAARHLSWPQGTLAGRLARGRKMLAKRLTRHGLILSGGALAAVLSEKAASGCVPPSLAVSTLKAAVAIAVGQAAAKAMVSTKVAVLMEGVLKAMSIAKIKGVMAVLLVVGLTVAGVGVTTNLPGTKAAEGEIPKKANNQKPEKAKAEEQAPHAKNGHDLGFKDILVQVQEQPTGSLIFGVGMNSDAGLTGSVVLNEKKQSSDTASGLSPVTPSYVVEPPDILLLEVAGLGKGSQGIDGEHLVRPDGTISLGAYGSVNVAGRSLGQLRAVIADHLANYAAPSTKLDVLINLVAYNSKTFYVISKGKQGEEVCRFPATGGDTVVGAIFKVIDGPKRALKGRVWLARPSGEILEVNWRAITQEGKSDTNYLIRSGDRVVVESPLPK